MINIRGVTKIFHSSRGDVEAVSSLTLTAKDGEVYGLIGTNGAGKTTTLRMIATTLSPTEGVIEVNGHDTIKQPFEVRSDIGLLFGGDTGLYDRLTARENLQYFGELYGMKADEIKERIEYLSKTFSMQEFLDRRAGTFSRGMKQKVAFARSIVHNPAVMLFDEPSAGLDIIAADEMEQFVAHCKSQGKTIILSSHDMPEVEGLCDRVGIIDHGKLLDEGGLAELKEKYGMATIKEIFLHLTKGRAAK